MLIARFPNISAYMSQNVSPSMYIRTVTLARVTVAVVFNKTQQLILSFELEWQSPLLLFKNSVRNAYFSRLLPIYKNTHMHIHTYTSESARTWSFIITYSKLDVHESVYRDTIMKVTNQMQIYKLIYFSLSALHV
jgi:hypothetical protein